MTITSVVTPPSSDGASSSPTQSTSSSPVTPPGGALTPGQWIALAGVYPGATSPAGEPDAQDLWTNLQSQNATDIGYLNSADYPGLTFGTQAILTQSLVIYVGPYDNPGEASAACATYLPQPPIGICTEGQVPASSGQSGATTATTQ